MMIRTSVPRHALFDRLGGFDGLEQAVQRLFGRVATDAALPELLPASGAADARWQVQMLLTDRLGGPMAYDGPDPVELRARLGIDAEKARLVAAHLLAVFREAGAAPAAIEELQTVLAEFAGLLGVPLATTTSAVAALAPVSCPATRDPREALIAGARTDAARAGVADRPLFVLDPDLTLVHLNPEAERGLLAADGELRRAFGLGAADLPGLSVLRFHPAPSQLQGLLQDVSKLPKETTWCFGGAVWKARLSTVRGSDERLLGYAIAWRDESEIHHAEAVFQRLRAQAEDLPVPIMYPDPMIEKWFGNAACEHALQRLAPHLPFPVNSLDGVPVQLFLPDDNERRALFRDPARLPYKSQLKMGPETIAILVSPILDQEQRYLGPQITWEIVHFTRPEDRAADPPSAPQSPVAPAPSPGTVEGPGGHAAPAAALRGEARALESAAADLQTLVRVLDLAADQAEGQGDPVAETGVAAGSGAAGQAETAIAAALIAVRRAADEATAVLTEEARGFTAELEQRVRDSMQRTQQSAEALGKIMTAATGLSELRAAFGEPAPATPPARASVSAAEAMAG